MKRATTRAGGTDLVDKLFNAAFFDARPARSNEYKAGVRALLELRVHAMPLRCSYELGSCQFDAFFSGVDEGHAIWRAHKQTDGA